MMILIFEGIATSGKSTVINSLQKALPRTLNTRVFTEQFTHIPIIKRTDELCKDFFTKLINEAFAGDYDIVLFDRLYLTQAFRARCSLDKYLDLEMILFTTHTTTIFLKVDEAEISNQISHAIEHRDPDWGEYVGTKGKTTQEQADYYIKQQRNQLELLSQSQLPYQIYDTTNRDYKSIVEDLKKKVLTDF